MPDAERILDKLALDLAKTPEDKAFVKGVMAGKKQARCEVLGVIVALYFLIAFIGHHASA